MSESWEWGYVCSHCEERFSNHVELQIHMIDEHGFKPTENSRHARYWRHQYCPLSEAEKKLNAIEDVYKRLRQHQVSSPFLAELDKILEGKNV